MKIAYQHILKFLVNKPSIEELSNKLFQLGHEHEIEGSVFDIEFTPNRGDCLSLLGLTRELNVFYDTDITLPYFSGNIPSLNINFINEANDKCPNISFLNIEIKNQALQYKDYLSNYFEDLKLNKVNFFTDISNYIAYEMGQPTHCYDFKSIGKDITLKDNIDQVKFKTLDGKNIDLKDSDLVFTSNNKIINLSGVMGGFDTACSNHTKSALIECAYFRPDSIIGKAVKYNLHSDASHKFERGTDPKCHDQILRRFIQIVSDHAEIKKLELYTHSNNNLTEIELDFDLIKVNKILGTSIAEDIYKDSLIKLGFDVRDEKIIAPSFRSDVSHQNDLAEELARVIGYDNLPVRSINLERATTSPSLSDEELLKQFLITNGFMEVINSPFCSSNMPKSIKVDNPLDSNRQFLRTNLTNSLVENLIYNEKRQKDSIKLFEISDIYSSSKDFHKKRLAIIISGRRGHNHLEFNQKLDHKYLIDLFQEIDIDASKFILNIDRNEIDSKIKTPIFTLESDIVNFSKNLYKLPALIKNPTKFLKYEPISEFPSSYRDLSFSVKNPTKIEELVSTLLDFRSNIIKHSFMFDFYENIKINETKVGFRFIFQSHEKTLTVFEIDNVIDEILINGLSIDSVSLPGIN